MIIAFLFHSSNLIRPALNEDTCDAKKLACLLPHIKSQTFEKSNGRFVYIAWLNTRCCFIYERNLAMKSREREEEERRDKKIEGRPWKRFKEKRNNNKSLEPVH